MIKAENLWFEYEGQETKKVVLKDINIEIHDGEFIAVLGHNGSGKSTFAKHLNAILLPSGGKAYVYGIDTTDEKKLFDVRKQVGMVFQNPDNQIVATVVEEDVAFGPENLGIQPNEIRRRVDESLATVDMTDFSKSAPHNLSGGQKQRVAIAGILAMKPACIVLDEPTAMLDPSGRREVLTTISRLNKESGITIILITHYMDEAAMADRVIVMTEGKICMDDIPANIFTKRDKLKSYGLDVPQVTELMYQLKKAGLPVNDRVINTEDCINELSTLLSQK